MEFLTAIWTWTLSIGAWQVPACGVALVLGGMCMIVARRLSHPTIDETGTSTLVKTLIMALMWVAGAILIVFAFVCLAAAFWPVVAPLFR